MPTNCPLFRAPVVIFVLAASGLPGAVPGVSEPISWRFAHPEAQILAGVDFRQLSATPDGVKIRAQFAAALGLPILEQTERLLMSAVVEANGKRSDVLILSGSFSLPQLRRMATMEGARMVPYKGLEIAAPPGAAVGDPHLAWISGPGGGTTVLIGTRPAIQAAAERSKAQLESLASVNPLFGRARALGLRYPVWITCETLPHGLGPKTLDRVSEELISGFDLAIQPANDPNLSIRILTADESSADAVLQQLQSSAAGGETSLLGPWLAQLTGSIEESSLVLGSPMALGSVAERVGPILAAFALPVDLKQTKPSPNLAIRAKVDSTANPPQTAPHPPPPKKLFVRIEGMEEGIKDIPYAARQ